MWEPNLWSPDYNAKLEKSSKRVISEVMHDTAPRHDFKKQSELHEKFAMMRIMMIGSMEQNQSMVDSGIGYK